MSDKLRVGIIGLGFIGTQKHLEGLPKIGRASCRERV